MGKSELMPQRFRRKAKGQGLGSSFIANEQISSSLISPPSAVDNLLCNNLLDSNNASELAEQTSQLSQSLTTANGTCHAEAELTESDTKGCNPALRRDNCVVAAGPGPHNDPGRLTEVCLDSYLPAELSGLSHSEIAPLCANQSLNLSACHVQKEDSLILVVFIMNSSESAIQQMLLQVDSEELEVNYSVENDQ